MLKNKFAVLVATAALLCPWFSGAAQELPGELIPQPPKAVLQQENVNYSILSLPFKIAGKVVKKAAEAVVTAPIKETKMEIKAAKEAAKLAKKAVKTAKKVKKTAEKIHEKTDGKDKDGNPVKKKGADIKDEDFKKAPELQLPETDGTLPPIIVERPEAKGEEVKAGSEAADTAKATEAAEAAQSPATNESQVSKPSEVSQQELEENKPLGFRESANRYKAQQEAAAKQAEQERLEKERAAKEEDMSSFRKAASRYKAQQEAAQE